MSSKVRGRNLTLFFKISANEYRTLAYATSCELDINKELVKVASKTSGSWDKYKSRAKSWKMTASFLMANTATTGVNVMDLLNATAPIAVCFATIERLGDARTAPVDDASTLRMSDGMNRYGLAFLTRCTYTGQNGAMATYSIELTGSGELYDDTSFTATGWQDEEIWTPTSKYTERTYKL